MRRDNLLIYGMHNYNSQFPKGVIQGRKIVSSILMHTPVRSSMQCQPWSIYEFEDELYSAVFEVKLFPLGTNTWRVQRIINYKSLKLWHFVGKMFCKLYNNAGLGNCCLDAGSTEPLHIMGIKMDSLDICSWITSQIPLSDSMLHVCICYAVIACLYTTNCKLVYIPLTTCQSPESITVV